MTWAGILDFLKSIAPAIENFLKYLGAGVVGAELQEGQQNKEELNDVAKANDAASAVDADIDGMRDKWR